MSLNMEVVFQKASSRFITVEKGRFKKCANDKVRRILRNLSEEMKYISTFFRILFESFLYAGSSYDGLKVNRPDEFDIDFKFKLPAELNVEVVNSDQPGFVYLKLNGWKKAKNDRSFMAKYGDINRFVDEGGYLSSIAIKQWMEGLVDSAININEENGEFSDMEMRRTITGPAVTLKVDGISIDLVAVIRLPGSQWPQRPVRQNVFRKTSFIVVPKQPKLDQADLAEHKRRYWRLSFPEQEREYMRGLQHFKPVLRSFKKFTDTWEHNIPSYFIKTVFLWEINVHRNNRQFWNSSYTDVFLYMLEVYQRRLENGNIPYFWSPEDNLIQPRMNNENISNIADFIRRMRNEIIENMDQNPMVLAEYLLTDDEFDELSDIIYEEYE